ncbi:hypothetical protein [Demequina iriomotensis]|uniref:hypothetical protein n=1 Tax=Demequina iriomotensis TaxID=1536641 RepID=UPI0012E05892|nr:hypothetical protein [Demequina iriomotensis]
MPSPINTVEDVHSVTSPPVSDEDAHVEAQPAGAGAPALLLLGLFVIATVVSLQVGDLFGVIATLAVAIAALIVPLVVAVQRSHDLAPFLAVPTVLSVLQNVYLLPVAGQVSTDAMQAVIVFNWAYAVVLVLVLAAIAGRGRTVENERVGRLKRVGAWSLAVVAFYGAALGLLHGASPIAMLATTRNLTAPFLFLLIGLYASRRASARRYGFYISALGVVSVAFGVYERYLVPSFWIDAGIAELWSKKGIEVNAGTGLPSNFHSSEMLGGEQLRRMVGTFADPVNFGTFLFAAFVLSWYFRRRFVALLMLLAAVPVVSKGAFLGFLVYATVWTRYLADRVVFVLSLVTTVAAGVVFYGFTQSSSTGSTTAHINGLFAAFLELPTNPFGHGAGRTGVLAGLFGEGAESAVTESGLGAIVGTLGVVGVAVFTVFLVGLARACLSIVDLRARVATTALLLAFVLNMMFNEVALSPNSCAVYFVALGLLIGQSLSKSEPARAALPRPLAGASRRRRSAGRRSGLHGSVQ